MMKNHRNIGLVIAASVVAAGCGVTAKEEIARRTQCKANLNRIAAEIERFRSSQGRWPGMLAELPGESRHLRCPSAEVGEDRTSGAYVWNLDELTLTENSRNHDVERLGVETRSSVTYKVVFDREGNSALKE